MGKFSDKILFVLLILSILLAFLIDGFLFFSKLNIPLLSYFKELLIVITGLSWYRIIAPRLRKGVQQIKQKLYLLLAFALLNYIAAIFIDSFIDPSYDVQFPPLPLSFGTLVYDYWISLVALSSFIAILVLIERLLFLRPRKRTRLYFRLFNYFLIGAAIAYYFNPTPIFQYSGSINSLLFYLSLIIAFLLSFHTDWIPYLTRREKIQFYFLSLGIFMMTAPLFDAVFDPHLAAFNLTAATFVLGIWVLTISYAIVVHTKLLLHLPSARALDRKMKEVNSLYNLARQLNAELDTQRLSQLIVELVSRFTDSQVALLLMLDSSRKQLLPQSHYNLSELHLKHHPFSLESELISTIHHNRRCLLIQDVDHSPYRKIFLQWHPQLQSILMAPLFTNRGQLMGAILTGKYEKYAFDIDDASLLEGFANQAAIAIENANLLRQSIERERLSQELKIARDVQLRLLPQEMPHYPGIELQASSLTAFEVGGDFFDFFLYQDGSFGLVVGDVSGKGTSAAFYMAEFKGILQTLAGITADPLQLACEINQIIYRTIERRAFITAIFARYCPQSAQLEIVRAGHPPALFYNARSHMLKEIHPPGLGIGLDKGPIFKKVTRKEVFHLETDDIILFYTDGLTEARNAAGNDFGEEGLKNLLLANSAPNLNALKNMIFDTILDFVEETPLHDDMTFVLLRKIKEERDAAILETTKMEIFRKDNKRRQKE